MGKHGIAYFLILVFIFPVVCSGGEIAPGLAEKIVGANPDAKIPILISPVRPAADLKTELSQNCKTRAERHKTGIVNLKNRAAAAQTGLMTVLYDMESSGLVSNVKSHWIINVISANITASEIEKLAARNDIERIYQLPEIRAVAPIEGTPTLETQALSSIEANLTTIGADSAWSLGYTGEGRIICSFDTGIDGDHPALYSTWKGHDGDSAAAWFDPIDQLAYPHVFAPYQVGSGFVEHGTHTMGIMVGYDSTIDRYVGVAPGARWISAATINLWGASIIDAFEWAADPDGDPNSLDDVPDVINHSWGIINADIGCGDYFWQMIDNTEALGIVNIFAAGNDGSDSLSINNPANRAIDSLDCFAVGAIDYTDSTLTSYSSRGPSDCDTVSIKPNAVAPGQYIRSSLPGGSYGWRAGTSMAAPHVSGAVAILRQYAPDATPDEIKEALLASCRSHPDWGTLPNNDYGWGMIYIPAAMDALVPAAVTELRVYSFDYTPINPGGTISGYVALENLGQSIDSVYGSITGDDNRITIITDSLYFGTVDLNDTSYSHIQFEAIVSHTVVSGTMLSVNFDLYGANGYYRQCKLYVQVGNKPQAGFYSHRNDSLRFTISNFGQFGFAYSSFYPLGYDGFWYSDTSYYNDIWEAALMIGIDSSHVSDGARTVIQEPDNDFAVSPGGDLVISTPGPIADQETFSIFNDSKAEHPMGLEIQQKTYSWNDYPDDNYVILEYIIRNISDSLLQDLYVGLFFDWELTVDYEGAGFASEENLGYVYHDTIGFPLHDPPKYRGISVINSEGASGQKLLMRPPVEPFYALTESEKIMALSAGVYDSLPYDSSDFAQVISTGPFTLSSGQSDSVIFAVLASDTLPNLISSAIQARNKYVNSTDVEIVEEGLLPEQFSLSQNYPNPFNPTTRISFALSTKSHVTLSVYNILGRNLINLLDKDLAAGTYQTSWNGRDRHGQTVSSGLYFYRLSAAGKSLTRKMILLK